MPREQARIQWGRLLSNIFQRWQAEAKSILGHARRQQWERAGRSEHVQELWRHLTLYILRDIVWDVGERHAPVELRHEDSVVVIKRWITELRRNMRRA